MQVYGLVGKKGSGKDTLSSFVKGFDSRFKVLHFASRLKEICTEVFKIESKYFNEPELKEVSIPSIHIDNYLAPLSQETGLDLEGRNLTAHTPRQLLQYVGTEYVRSVCDSYWVDCIKKQILENKKVIIADTRFKNEVEAIRQFDGKIIFLIREGQQSLDQHKSETELSDVHPDSVLYFKNGDFSLHAKIAKAISENDFQTCRQCDWRNQ